MSWNSTRMGNFQDGKVAHHFEECKFFSFPKQMTITDCLTTARNGKFLLEVLEDGTLQKSPTQQTSQSKQWVCSRRCCILSFAELCFAFVFLLTRFALVKSSFEGHQRIRIWEDLVESKPIDGTQKHVFAQFLSCKSVQFGVSVCHSLFNFWLHLLIHDSKSDLKSWKISSGNNLGFLWCLNFCWCLNVCFNFSTWVSIECVFYRELF